MSGLRWTEERLNEHLARNQHTNPDAQRQPAARKAPAGVPTVPKGGKTRLQALGRLAEGEMNATEERYAAYLDEQKAAGAVVWWEFEAIKLKLAKNTHLTVDFFVMYADRRLEAIDVKGAKAIVTDDARAKIKIAADKFPWPFKLVYPKRKKDGGGWEVEEIA